MELKITVFGISAAEGRQLKELLCDMEGVEDVRTLQNVGYAEPGTIHASAEHLTVLASVVAGVVGTRLLGSITDDVYKASKDFIRTRIEEWKRDALPDPDRLRIELEFSDEDELRNRRPN